MNRNESNNLILNFFDWVFEKQIELQRFCYRKHKRLNALTEISYMPLFFSFLLYGLTNFKIMYFLVNIFTLVTVVLFALSHINTVLTSFRKFILYGVLSEVIIMISLDEFISKRITADDFILTYIIHYILMFICLLLTWCFISFIAKNDIATLTNLIFSTIIGIIVLLKDLVLELFTIDYVNNESSYDYTQVTTIQFDMKFLPLLVTNLTATLICAIKHYWINNYNEGKDITMELIKQDNNDKDT